ncbi:hypothetical protein AKJ16_DCAP05985, partial [Drosera capensis]
MDTQKTQLLALACASVDPKLGVLVAAAAANAMTGKEELEEMNLPMAATVAEVVVAVLCCDVILAVRLNLWIYYYTNSKVPAISRLLIANNKEIAQSIQSFYDQELKRA